MRTGSRPAHRILAALTAGALALVLVPLATGPAEAAVRAKRVVRCRGGGQCWPAAFAFTPNGRKLFYAERLSGRIRVFNFKTRKDRRWHRIRNLATSGEQGVLGLAVDPRWPRKRWLYVYYTQGSPTQNRVVRIRKRKGNVRIGRLLRIPANSFHNGGVIHFGPDGMLYAVTGDAGNRALSQSVSSPAGKVLRVTKAGKRPGDNPIGGSKAFSTGHRNSFGFTFDPETGRLWQTENGPECTDELNLVLPGRNYGWGPGSSCPNTSTEGASPTGPAATYTPVIAPTGAAFCQGCRLGGAIEGRLLFGSFNDRRIRSVKLTPDRIGVAAQTVLYNHSSFVLAVEAAPSGRVFFSDERGIYRLRR